MDPIDLTPGRKLVIKLAFEQPLPISPGCWRFSVCSGVDGIQTERSGCRLTYARARRAAIKISREVLGGRLKIRLAPETGEVLH